MKIISLCTVLLTLLSKAYSNEKDLYSLDHYLAIHGVPEEKNAGHIWTEPEYDPKAMSFLSILENQPKIRTVAEIGFCFGHTSEIFLKANPEMIVTSFDLMTHWYNDTGKEYIDLKYPKRHTLIRGDSRKTVPEFLRKNQGKTFDLILIDGGHEYDAALKDIRNMRHLAGSDTILIVDDTNFGPVNKAWEKCISEGIVEEIERYSDYALGWLIGRYVK